MIPGTERSLEGLGRTSAPMPLPPKHWLKPLVASKPTERPFPFPANELSPGQFARVRLHKDNSVTYDVMVVQAASRMIRLIDLETGARVSDEEPSSIEVIERLNATITLEVVP